MPLIPGDQFWVNIQTAWEKGNLGTNLVNSFIMAAGITFGKIVISMLGAFSIVYFDYRLRTVAFVTVFCTLMLPVEVRILPTYEMAANLFGPLQPLWDLLHLNGLVLFRQFFLTIPEELCEAAKMDGASPMVFFRKILLPLSKTNIAALVVIEFVYGWNQYLWPLLITTNPKMLTAVIGLQHLIPAADDLPYWNVALAGTLIVMLPPVLVVLFMQRWFVKGLVDPEK
jgi:sn-glycerol 3-phosphate transport system permease protein